MYRALGNVSFIKQMFEIRTDNLEEIEFLIS